MWRNGPPLIGAVSIPVTPSLHYLTPDGIDQGPAATEHLGAVLVNVKHVDRHHVIRPCRSGRFLSGWTACRPFSPWMGGKNRGWGGHAEYPSTLFGELLDSDSGWPSRPLC